MLGIYRATVMTSTATAVLFALGIAVMLATEILRSVAHRRGGRLRWIGDTEDITKWGILIGIACFISGAICELIWS